MAYAIRLAASAMCGSAYAAAFLGDCARPRRCHASRSNAFRRVSIQINTKKAKGSSKMHERTPFALP